MKKVAALFSFVLLSICSIAQDFNHVAPVLYYNRAILYNNTDFNSNADLIQEKGNMKTQAGIELGINKEKPTSMLIQILYSKQGQQFSGNTVLNNVYYSWNTKVDLEYIKVPFLVEFKTTELKDFKTSLSAGLYGAYRINYKDFTTYTDTTSGNPNGFTENFENQFYAYDYNNASQTDVAVTTKKNLYTNFNAGLMLAYGINYKLSKHVFFDAKLFGDYSLSTPENQSYKELKPRRFTLNKDRSDTHLINYGLCLALRYQFKESQ